MVLPHVYHAVQCLQTTTNVSVLHSVYPWWLALNGLSDIYCNWSVLVHIQHSECIWCGDVWVSAHTVAPSERHPSEWGRVRVGLPHEGGLRWERAPTGGLGGRPLPEPAVAAGAGHKNGWQGTSSTTPSNTALFGGTMVRNQHLYDHPVPDEWSQQSHQLHPARPYCPPPRPLGYLTPPCYPPPPPWPHSMPVFCCGRWPCWLNCSSLQWCKARPGCAVCWWLIRDPWLPTVMQIRNYINPRHLEVDPL